MEPISGKHRIGAVLAGAGWFIAFRRGLAMAPSRPHSPERLIFVAYAFLASLLLAYAWGVFMAVMARRGGWTPRGCRLAGYPLVFLGLFCSYLGIVGAAHIKAIADASGVVGGIFASDLAGRFCRRLAFPELGWSGKDPEQPSLSITPRPDVFGR
jgi:hypothetical protein